MQRSRWIALNAGCIALGVLPWVFAWAAVDARGIYHALCHQLPERSLVLHDHVMAVCSRCAGIHLGLSVGALVAMSSRARAFFMKHGTRLVIATVALNLADWASSLVVPLSHVSRAATGLSFGVAATAFMLAALSPSPRCPSRPEAARANRPRTLASSKF